MYSPRELNSPIADIYRHEPHGRTSPENKSTKLIRGIGVRQVRLVCGMVLFTYLVSHFLNHALGNISMEALASGVYYHTLFWQFLPVAIVFYTACWSTPGSASGRSTNAGSSAGKRSSRCSSYWASASPR